jgi:sigma-B regulation protein RsbU (phosphoserine phosphatase)
MALLCSPTVLPKQKMNSGELYGLERSCTVTGKTWPQVPAEAVKEAIVNDVQDFIGEQIVYDDITQLLKKSEDS